MYNYLLKAFVAVADSGSFTKAADKLHITPTAVMKQVNSLESHLDLKLISRTNHGIRLTAAGEEIYKDAGFLFDYSRKSVENARRAMEAESKTFRIGTSMLNPARKFMDIWYEVSADFPDYSLTLVPFEDTHDGILSEIAMLGRKFDFLLAVCDSKAWLEKCNMLTVGYYRQICCMSRKHPLATRTIIDIEDLCGETVMMVKHGDSATNDRIRAELLSHPRIQIEDTPQFYDMSVFNRCAESGNILFLLECWQDIHPELVSIPVNWDYRTPYGILYPLDPSPDIRRFINAAESKLNTASVLTI